MGVSIVWGHARRSWVGVATCLFGFTRWELISLVLLLAPCSSLPAPPLGSFAGCVLLLAVLLGLTRGALHVVVAYLQRLRGICEIDPGTWEYLQCYLHNHVRPSARHAFQNCSFYPATRSECPWTDLQLVPARVKSDCRRLKA